MPPDFSSLIEDTLALPAFIKPIPGMQGRSNNPCEMFEFWAPTRIGLADADYWAGQQHFKTAVAYARATGANYLLANAVGAMRGKAIGPIERGFLEALASSAIVGRVPDPASETVVAITVGALRTTEEEIRYGESEAAIFLEIARVSRCPEVIAAFLDDAIDGTMDYGMLTFIWTVCGAAMMGAAN